jgi:hypothetical protein
MQHTFETFSNALTHLGIPSDRHEEYFEDGFSIQEAKDDWDFQVEADRMAEYLQDRMIQELEKGGWSK